jgi:hypothetical protein
MPGRFIENGLVEKLTVAAGRFTRSIEPGRFTTNGLVKVSGAAAALTSGGCALELAAATGEAVWAHLAF